MVFWTSTRLRVRRALWAEGRAIMAAALGLSTQKLRVGDTVDVDFKDEGVFEGRVTAAVSTTSWDVHFPCDGSRSVRVAAAFCTALPLLVHRPPPPPTGASSTNTRPAQFHGRRRAALLSAEAEAEGEAQAEAEAGDKEEGRGVRGRESARAPRVERGPGVPGALEGLRRRDVGAGGQPGGQRAAGGFQALQLEAQARVEPADAGAIQRRRRQRRRPEPPAPEG